MNRRVYLEGTTVVFEMYNSTITEIAREIAKRAGVGKHDITVGLLSDDRGLDGWYKAIVDVSPSGSCVKVTEERNSGYKVGLQALFC